MNNKTNPLIQVVPWNNNKLESHSSNALFLLERDNWNDYHYYTSYYLHSTSLINKTGKISLIGYLKILKKGQLKHEQELIPLGYTDDLGEDFCSLPSSLNYYERLSLIEKEVQQRLLWVLKDVVMFPEVKESFKNEEGYKKSLMRYLNENDQLFQLAPTLIHRSFHKFMDLDLHFEFQTADLLKPLVFKFDAPKYGMNNHSLPDRIAVLIGRNGSGKSTILSRISRLALTSTLDREDPVVKRIGTLTPKGIGFPRIIFISYNGFDSFNTPGIYKTEKETIIQEMKNGLGRYVFCGIRDVVTEMEDLLVELRVDENGKLTEGDIMADRVENNILKSADSITREFWRNLSIIKEIKEDELLTESLEILRKEYSLYSLLDISLLTISENESNEFFRGLSTGHKFVLHSITSIIAYGAPRSLILFDEPENHLHPPILACMMKAIRLILNKQSSFMIASTHSPVVLQECLSKQVQIIRRNGGTMTSDYPLLETFGENIGILTREVFDLNAEFTDFHETLDHVIDQIDFFGKPTIENIEKLFPTGLSIQARSYVLSKLNLK